MWHSSRCLLGHCGANLDRLSGELLVDNAIRHNVDNGQIDIVAETRAGSAILRVVNTGPVVPPEDVERLFEPFRKACADRTRSTERTGLGLSVVRVVAIATARPSSSSRDQMEARKSRWPSPRRRAARLRRRDPTSRRRSEPETTARACVTRGAMSLLATVPTTPCRKAAVPWRPFRPPSRSPRGTGWRT